MASPPWLHTLWRQMQGWLLLLPPQVSCPSVSRLCRIPDTAQKSEVRRRGREEAERKKMKKEKETAQTTDFFHLCQQSCLPRYFPIVVCIHIIVLYISCLSRNRDQSIFDFGLVQCFIFVWCILGSVLRDYTPSCRKRASKCVGDFVKTVIVQQNLIQQN